tara:strand:- start:60 stop:452 length:393 start_codon:yes stop_codon:yes gene_type:complete
MNTYKVLTKIYETWGEINRISPLPSADDLRFDALHGRTSISNKQIKWLEKFQRVWAVAEDHEHKMSQTEEDKCMELWHDYMEWDKRGFQEFFIEEFGFSINDDITYKQLKLLCEVLIPHAKTYYHPKRSK